MRHLGLRHCLAGCAMIFAASSHATTYEINSTEDADVTVVRQDNADGSSYWQVTSSRTDGFCSLREAVVASNYQIAVDGCAAGTASDTIKLAEGQTYLLTEGELVVGDGKKIVITTDDTVDPPTTTISEEPLANQIRFELQLDAFEEADGKVLPVITADHNSRLFNIDAGGAVTLTNLDLRDGDASAAGGSGNGGLIEAMGVVIIGENMSLTGGTAVNGGAFYLAEGSGVAFRNGGRFENNTASGVGSVIATSDTFDGSVIGYQFYMAGNTAGSGVTDAAAIHMDGDEDSRIGLELANGTIVNNLGGAINVVTDNYSAVLANMTIAFNDGTALTLEETAFDDPADAEPTDHILHTVMVGNTLACGGAGLIGTSEPSAAARLLFTITDDLNCPAPQEVQPVTTNPNSAQSDIFLGQGREACPESATGADACELMGAEELGGPYPGYLPNPEPSAVATDAMAPSLFDRGFPENVASIDQCETSDYRGKSRGGAGGRCDVGAVEYLRAQAAADEIDLISGQSVLADVVANDLNDTTIDCARVSTPDTCMSIVIQPERGSASVEVDALGYPRIRYTPASNFHGVDQLRYEVHRDAFFGGTDIGTNQSEIANLVADPASGLTEKKSIGAQGLWGLLLLAIAGLIRRYRAGLLVVMACLSGPTMALDITVNSLIDSVVPVKGDGLCTLREALENASGAGSPDCAYGGKSEDRILLPAGDINLMATLTVEGGSVVIEGKGAQDEDPADDEDTLTRILGDGSFRLFEVQAPQSSGQPGVTFRYLTLENGAAVDNGQQNSGSGGVIITGGSVIFDRVAILGNQADTSGGVAYVRTNAGNEKLISFNRAYVSGNTAGGAGGVVSTTPLSNEVVNVAMVDSTFENNVAGTEGGVIDANIAAGQFAISNSTFLGNSAVDKGAALDLSDMIINATIANATFMNNAGGSNGIELGSAPIQVQMGNSIYFASGDACSTAPSSPTALYESHYNAFSGAACAATTESNNQTATGDAALAATLSDATGSSSDYLPPYLMMADPGTDMVLVDQGNDVDALQSGTSFPKRCRDVDLRGIARTSGGSCDIGAYEYQKITAEDDEGSNRPTPDSRAPVDILDNDLASDGAEIVYLDEMDPTVFKTGVFWFEHAEPKPATDPVEYETTSLPYVQDTVDPTLFVLDSTGTASEDYNGATIQFVWRYYNEDQSGYDLKCGEPIPQAVIDANPNLLDDGDVADECVVMFTPAKTDVFKESVCQATSDAPVMTAFVYGFEDSNGERIQVGDEATVVITVNDKPPVLKAQSVVNSPGQNVVFHLEASDPDAADANFDWNNYYIHVKNEPSFAKEDEYGEALGVGLLIDQDAGTVTYIPDSNFNTFKDTFSLEVEDVFCDNTSSAATFTITYPRESASGGGGGGSAGWLLLGGMMLLLRRRFAA
ncbi:MAG: hypothetical protein CL537_00975 [Alcanivoracaceae bacterium]|nr:hypothetical protein [Alcanivoracaceae bacterium]